MENVLTSILSSADDCLAIMARSCPLSLIPGSFTFVYEVEFSSVIRGHHVYKATWSPTLGESLTCRKDERNEANEHDEYAIGTYLDDNQLVGHVPMELSFLVYTFLRAHLDNNVQVKVTGVQVKVTGTRTLENGLVVPASFQARTTNLAMAKRFEGEICRLRELCSHMEIKIETLRRRRVSL